MEISVERLLTAMDVGKILGCSRSMVYKLRQQGELLPRWKLFEGEKGWRWSYEDVQRYISRFEVLEPREDPTPKKFIPIERPRKSN